MINLHLKVDNEIELKIPKKEDAAAIFKLISENRKWLATYMEWEERIKTTNDILNFFGRNKHISYYDQGFPLIMWYKEEIVGIISYNKGNIVKREVEVGYWLAEEFSGKGIVTRATKALINFAFNLTDITSILICCEKTNINSIKIPQKLGFEFIKEELNTDIFYKNGKGIKLTYQLKKVL